MGQHPQRFQDVGCNHPTDYHCSFVNIETLTAILQRRSLDSSMTFQQGQVCDLIAQPD